MHKIALSAAGNNTLSHGYLRNSVGLLVHHFLHHGHLHYWKTKSKSCMGWDYFECNQEGNSSKCKIKIVKSHEEKECDRIIRGKNLTNFKQHMSKSHPDQYVQLFETNSANSSEPPFK